MDKIPLKKVPVLDPGFLPASLWTRKLKEKVSSCSGSEKIAISLERNDGTVSVQGAEILPHSAENAADNIKFVERLLKFLLWMKGGWKVGIYGNPRIASEIAGIYSAKGKRSFDSGLIGQKIYGHEIKITAMNIEDLPPEHESTLKLGGHWKGCRVGFDLGGSDRKCAAVIDGKVVHTEEIAWDPYFEKDPDWHRAGINDSIRRAAEKLPRVDAIGGSSAGVYVDNQVRVASLFRGVSEEDFNTKVKDLFIGLAKEWGNIPFVVVNDGEVTALSGSMSLNENALLGISMGTSLAAGYVTPGGNITNWLNELAFAPIDYRDDAPVDEWSGDIGCGVQYFSQQAVARLAPSAGFNFNEKMPFAERLVAVQDAMKKDDPKARKIYQTIGAYFGYAVAHYADFYELNNLLILGRVTSGAGGEIILDEAREVLNLEFPELAGSIKFSTPDEKNKRHGQAVAAASLPE